MKGKIKIAVKNKHIDFRFVLDRNITILTGDSGTGKTKLINMVRDYAESGKSSGVTLSCEKPCLVLAGKNWEYELEQTHESVVFVEESTAFLTSQAFAEAVQHSDNYYVLVTREPLPQIPYSIDSIKWISKHGKTPKIVKLHENISVKKISDFPYDAVIVEDSKSGFFFFQRATESHKLECMTANGKSGIIKLLQSSKKRRILVIADAAALGSEIKGLLYFRASTDKKIDFFLPESFEWLILRSAIFDRDADVRQKLADPVEYIDCKEYFSWERFFTALLVSASKGKPNLEYPSHKGSIPSGYLTEANIDSILNAMNRGKQ